MGFTVEDMLIISKDKYEMQLIAGKNGLANSISWLLMVEDMTITSSFRGKELAVTTGLGFSSAEKLLALVKRLDEKNCAGIIVNTGGYLMEIPSQVKDYCEENDLPLLTSPWNIEMSEMIKDLTVRIFLQTQTDEQISKSFIMAIEHPQETASYKESLSAAFDVDGDFQVALFTTEDLDSMDSMERKRIGYRLQIYLENISHNAHFFYYDGCFIIILNAVLQEDANSIISGFVDRVKRRMPDKEIFTGMGSRLTDAALIHISYQRAKYSVQLALKEKKPLVNFDDLGFDRVLYSISDKLVMEELIEKFLSPLIEYDEIHNAALCQTLEAYLKFNGSVAAVSKELFIHKNTIVYRMNKIKEILPLDFEDGEIRLYLYLGLKALKTF